MTQPSALLGVVFCCVSRSLWGAPTGSHGTYGGFGHARNPAGTWLASSSGSKGKNDPSCGRNPAATHRRFLRLAYEWGHSPGGTARLCSTRRHRSPTGGSPGAAPEPQQGRGAGDRKALQTGRRWPRPAAHQSPWAAFMSWPNPKQPTFQ